MKNETTPRTLAECQFTTGYAGVPRPTWTPIRVAFALTYAAAALVLWWVW